MENSQACKNCRKRTLVPDDVTGNMVCSSCSVVQDFDNFEAHIGGITGDAGTYVRVGTAGSGSAYSYKQTKIYEAQKLIDDFMYKLGLEGSKSQEVKLLVEKVTDGEYGSGEWFPVLVGACSYVVMRKDQKMLPMVEIADLVGCDVYELGRMINRVVDYTDQKLPEFDIVNSFERALKSIPSFGKISGEVMQRMLQQGVFLVQCLIKWFVTTGRQPIPVVAAVLVFVAELNELDVKIDGVARELHVAISTCRRRHKELLARLVEVAQVLPWGNDVTTKNIMKNAPYVIQYMEMKSMEKRNSAENVNDVFDVEELVGNGFSEFNLDVVESDSSYFESGHGAIDRIDRPDKFKISYETLAMIYSNFVDEISSIDASKEIGVANSRKRRQNFDVDECMDWWRGKSELSKRVLLKEILEKDVGLDRNPPSFEKACSDEMRRREKIRAAKKRIERVMKPRLGDEDFEIFDLEKSTKRKRKRSESGIDWEDLIIETLLLHDVKDEEIQNGHYNALFALHVFGDNENSR
ncbi:plant-specific TFIIB-related protein PTF2 [Andrographis paniculata]|uniref:plant-specific TFIIB-related protein PTF2 n=1 Tax=Andrographis paniculata TaxID=175694 RepID=UPI0021E81A1B|nr:plant-specific TFIIB-related protein PTF2 [Andrographis paniculata]